MYDAHDGSILCFGDAGAAVEGAGIDENIAANYVDAQPPPSVFVTVYPYAAHCDSDVPKGNISGGVLPLLR